MYGFSGREISSDGAVCLYVRGIREMRDFADDPLSDLLVVVLAQRRVEWDVGVASRRVIE